MIWFESACVLIVLLLELPHQYPSRQKETVVTLALLSGSLATDFFFILMFSLMSRVTSLSCSMQQCPVNVTHQSSIHIPMLLAGCTIQSRVGVVRKMDYGSSWQVRTQTVRAKWCIFWCSGIREIENLMWLWLNRKGHPLCFPLVRPYNAGFVAHDFLLYILIVWE